MNTSFIKYIYIFFVSIFVLGVNVCAQEVNTLIEETLNEYEKMGDEKEDLSELYPKRVFEYRVKDVPLREAVEILIQKSGLKIFVDPKINAKITLFLKNVAPKDILRILVDGYDLAYRETEGVIRIMSLEDFKEQFGYTFGERIDENTAESTISSNNPKNFP